MTQMPMRLSNEQIVRVFSKLPTYITLVKTSLQFSDIDSMPLRKLRGNGNPQSEYTVNRVPCKETWPKRPKLRNAGS